MGLYPTFSSYMNVFVSHLSLIYYFCVGCTIKHKDRQKEVVERNPNLTAELHLSIHSNDFNFESLGLFLLQSKDRHFDSVSRLENCENNEMRLRKHK